MSRLRSKNRLINAGSTLVEVMVTAAIASGIILAVMEAVRLTTQSARSVQVSSDWTSLVATLSNVTQSNCACSDVFGVAYQADCATPLTGIPQLPAMAPGAITTYAANTYDLCGQPASVYQAVAPTACQTANGNTAVAALSSILLGPSGAQTPILDTCAEANAWTTGNCKAGPPGGVIAQQINLRVQPGNVSATIYVPGASGGGPPTGCTGLSPVTGTSGLYQMYRDNVYLEVYAVKVQAAVAASGGGTTWAPMPGGSAYLYLGYATGKSNGIPFQVMRCGGGSYAGQIVSCFATTDIPQLVCSQMGGTLIETGTIPYPQCQLPNLPLGPTTTTSVGAPSASPDVGERLALLQATWGSPSSTDVAIGVATNSMWFSAGTSSNFAFWGSNGSVEYLSLSASGASGALVQIGSGTGANTNWLSFAGSAYQSPAVGTNGEKIQLYGPTPGSQSSSDYSLGVDSASLWYNVPSGSDHRFHGGPVSIDDLGSGGLGKGNVPHGCTVQANTTTVDIALVQCPTGTIVLGGGGECGGVSPNSMISSLPYLTNSVREQVTDGPWPLYNLSLANMGLGTDTSGWLVACVSTTGTATVYAICCEY